MFNQDDMQELLTYEGNGDGVISIYLDTDSAHQSTEAIRLIAKGLLKEVQTQHERESQTIERYLDLSYDWSKPGLALFCGQGGSFFRSYSSPVAFRNRIRLGPRPYVKPLAHLLDHYAHFGVIDGATSHGLQPMDEIIRGIVAVLEKTGALEQREMSEQVLDASLWAYEQRANYAFDIIPGHAQDQGVKPAFRCSDTGERS